MSELTIFNWINIIPGSSMQPENTVKFLREFTDFVRQADDPTFADTARRSSYLYPPPEMAAIHAAGKLIQIYREPRGPEVQKAAFEALGAILTKVPPGKIEPFESTLSESAQVIVRVFASSTSSSEARQLLLEKFKESLEEAPQKPKKKSTQYNFGTVRQTAG